MNQKDLVFKIAKAWLPTRMNLTKGQERIVIEFAIFVDELMEKDDEKN